MQGKHVCASAILVIATASLFGLGTAVAQTSVSSPVVYRDMAVYPIEGTTAASSPLTIGQAMQRGLAIIRRGTNGAVSVDNLSAQAILVPFGTLLTGGLQDQVVGLNALIPPKAAGFALSVFCVDPFRSTPRPAEDTDAFAASGALIPSRMAQLSLLLNSANTDAAWRLRQSGVWWSIDTLRARLERKLGGTLKPAVSVPWTRDLSSQNNATRVLSSRSANWTASLPQALSDLRLEQTQAPYMRALGRAAKLGAGVRGAVFAINGKVVGAEVYGSAILFQQMWPHLLRAYATEAIAAQGRRPGQIPSVGAVNRFLSAGPPLQAGDQTTDASAGGPREDVLYSDLNGANGDLIAATYLPTTLPARRSMTPDALVVDILKRGTVDGRSVSTLANGDVIEFNRDAKYGIWSATASVSPETEETAGAQQIPNPPRFEELLSVKKQGGQWGILENPDLVGLMVLLIAILYYVVPPASRVKPIMQRSKKRIVLRKQRLDSALGTTFRCLPALVRRWSNKTMPLRSAGRRLAMVHRIGNYLNPQTATCAQRSTLNVEPVDFARAA